GVMDVVLPFLVVAVGYAVVMWGLMRLAARARRRGVGTAIVGAVDELFHPANHQTHLESLVEDERKAPIPSPGDGNDDDIDGGIRL
ncbi:hypothetical protein, partial [Actinophytocola sp.]|uniref:hypothetical protein n=1 Tax=Actinophytocola sp. TaxID=1872138 RepID=UPI002ED826E6